MSKATFKNKKPMQLNISDQHIDVEALDTFEQFCNNIKNPPQQKEQNDRSFLQDSFDEENTVKKQDICIHLSVSCSDDEEMNPLYIQSLRLSSPQHEYSFNERTNESIKFIQFEEFQPGRKSSSKTISQSDSIKSSESHQNIFIYHLQNKTTACKYTNNNQKIPHKENHLPQPTKMQSLGSNSLQDSNVMKSFIKVKKHLEIEIPEIEDSCSSQEQTLIKQQLNTSESHPEDYKIKLQHIQEELQCLMVSNKLENDNLFNHVQQVTQDNVSLRKEIVEFQVMVDDKDLQIENLLKMNKQLMTEKQIPRDSGDKFKYLQKPELQTIQASPPKLNEKIQYLIGKLNQKSNENSSLQYHISILKNKIEEFQNFYYLENRRELCIEPIEAEFSSPLPKQTPSMSLQSQKGQPDLCNTLKHNLSYSSITKEDNLKLQSKKDVGSSAQLLNKIKKKHQTEGLNSGTTQIQTYIKSIKQLEQPLQNTNLLCFRKQKQEKVFSIQTSPQVQKLLTEKPVQSSDVSRSNTNSQLKYDQLEIRNERQNFFYQMTALSRKTSDGIKQEDLSKLSTPNIRLSQNGNLGLLKHNQNSVKDLLEPTRKLSQFSRNTLFNKQERAIQIPPLSNPQFSRSSCDHNIEGGSKHQRNVSCNFFLSQRAQETKPHFLTIFEF